uniref:Uncharacterized protein n=1 Tax=Pipistrellus kuhlii TaxID=59472 RepID=A0A7J7ZJC1_PIPKU|nr:hypothetical protein mPipKuh1_009468 [Pipistrellus kuhlii]
MSSMPNICLRNSSPAGEAQISYFGEPMFLLQRGPSSPHWAGERSMVPDTMIFQPQHELKGQVTAVGTWTMRRGSFLAKRAREANINAQEKTVNTRILSGKRHSGHWRCFWKNDTVKLFRAVKAPLKTYPIFEEIFQYLSTMFI